MKIRPKKLRAGAARDPEIEGVVQRFFAEFVDNAISDQARLELLERIAHECLRTDDKLRDPDAERLVVTMFAQFIYASAKRKKLEVLERVATECMRQAAELESRLRDPSR